MKISVTPLRVAFAFMMTPAAAYMIVFWLILQTHNEQLILIMLTNVMSFYQGMASTSSTMMTGKDLFRHTDESEDDPPPAPSKVTRKTEVVTETPPIPAPEEPQP